MIFELSAVAATGDERQGEGVGEENVVLIDSASEPTLATNAQGTMEGVAGSSSEDRQCGGEARAARHFVAGRASRVSGMKK